MSLGGLVAFFFIKKKKKKDIYILRKKKTINNIPNTQISKKRFLERSLTKLYLKSLNDFSDF